MASHSREWILSAYCTLVTKKIMLGSAQDVDIFRYVGIILTIIREYTQTKSQLVGRYLPINREKITNVIESWRIQILPVRI